MYSPHTVVNCDLENVADPAWEHPGARTVNITGGSLNLHNIIYEAVGHITHTDATRDSTTNYVMMLSRASCVADEQLPYRHARRLRLRVIQRRRCLEPPSRLRPLETVLGGKEICNIVNPCGKYFLGTPDNILGGPNCERRSGTAVWTTASTAGAPNSGA